MFFIMFKDRHQKVVIVFKTQKLHIHAFVNHMRNEVKTNGRNRPIIAYKYVTKYLDGYQICMVGAKSLCFTGVLPLVLTIS